MKISRIRKQGSMLGLAFLSLLLVVTSVGLLGCQPAEEGAAPPEEGGAAAPPEEGVAIEGFQLVSPAFGETTYIPKKYDCDQDPFVSPPLMWGEPPEGTQSLALRVYDPRPMPLQKGRKEGQVTYWILFNIPPDVRELPERISTIEEGLPSGALQGTNDFGEVGYHGVCGVRAQVHRIYFTLYALDQPLELEAGVSRKEFLEALQGHIIDQAELQSSYHRIKGF